LEKHLRGKQYLEVLMLQAYSASRNLETVTQSGNPSRYSQEPQMLKRSTFSYNSASQPFALNVRVWRSRVRILALKSAIENAVVYDFPQSFQQTTAGTGPLDNSQLSPSKSFLFDVCNILPFHAVN
jgi:hypothetical protein